ncbi:sirohydrochlorin cobaltochelatase [Celerinatantimonas sp. YJH-8]|uniref:sirohydrochlorin cobaltochelatase n=1 Tax=Celerinatantimonas sp. YJH-8 TaxID=3228714 RepID=UPI0038C07AA8
MLKRYRHYQKGQAIVLSCFGSLASCERYINLKQQIAARYPDCDVVLALSSKTVLKRLNQEAHGHPWLNLPQQLARLDLEGYSQIIVIPCYLYPTDEYRSVRQVVDGFTQFSLATIWLTPAIMQKSADSNAILGALSAHFSREPGVNLFIYHGAPQLNDAGHQALTYSMQLLTQLSPRHFSCSLEGVMPYRLLADALVRQIRDLGQWPVRLIPMLLVSGNHFRHDLTEIQADLATRLGRESGIEVAAPIAGEQFCLLDFAPVTEVIFAHIDEARRCLTSEY